MTASVIQGSFLGSQPRLAASIQRSHAPPPRIPAKAATLPPLPPATGFGGWLPGPPTPAFAARPPGPPVPAFAGRQGMVQRQGAGGVFAVEAGQVGLLSGGGRPLPEAVRGKMEAALGADFSNVRVHVGPQAERIGAIAFTLGSDIYFAPGRFQPDTVHGQQLLGHELAHVVQQRAGRVRNPLGSGIAVVQDHALEAEADRLGRHAAANRVAAQPKMSSSAAQRSAAVQISGPISRRANASPGGGAGQVLQRKGNPPYKREITLQTNYVTLKIKHPLGGARDDTEANSYQVLTVMAKTSRPPVYLKGLQESNQGQHKVAYAATWRALELMHDQDLPTAKKTLAAIRVTSAVPWVEDPNITITVAMQYSSPPAADELITMAHNYLVSMQRDDPSWRSDKPEELKGKGERQLASTLGLFRQQSSFSDDQLREMFALGSGMDKLYDVTGRNDAEMQDAEERADTMLRVHNSRAMTKANVQVEVARYKRAKRGSPY